MKKIMAIVLFATSTSVFGHGPRTNQHYYHHNNHNRWVAPLIVGGVVGYALSQQQPQVYYYPPLQAIPYGYVQNCSVWVERLNYDGSITRYRTCN